MRTETFSNARNVQIRKVLTVAFDFFLVLTLTSSAASDKSIGAFNFTVIDTLHSQSSVLHTRWNQRDFYV